jgi:hypothetical protein
LSQQNGIKVVELLHVKNTYTQVHLLNQNESTQICL